MTESLRIVSFAVGILSTFVFIVVFYSPRSNYAPKTVGIDDLFNKYVLVDERGDWKVFESMKSINEFSLFEIVHGASVFPFEEGTNPMNMYFCECDLEELECFLNDLVGEDSPFLERRDGSITRRFAGGISSLGMILAGSVGAIMLLIKTNTIRLRIFAKDEIEAEMIASEEISSRILSEVFNETPSKDKSSLNHHYEHGNPYWDEMKEECEKCEKFRLKKLEKELEEKDAMIEILRKRIKDLTTCEEDGESRFQEPGEDEKGRKGSKKKAYLEVCRGECQDSLRESVSCLKLYNWEEGETILFGSSGDELAKKSINKYCSFHFDAAMIEGSQICEPADISDKDLSITSHVAYMKPGSANKEILDDFQDDFSSLAIRWFRIGSCYNYFQYDE